MDETEEYIKMSEKAIELQKEWNPKDGDLACDPSRFYGPRILCGNCDMKHGSYLELDGWKKDGWFCIFRQDQLQEMVGIKTTKDWDHIMINGRQGFIDGDMIGYIYTIQDYSEYRCCKTMEQLWLAFAMKEKYSKIWNGEDWIEN